MSYNVIVSEDAHDDIDGVLQYIVNVLCNPIAAKSLLNEIEKTYSDLAVNPVAYAYCNDKRLRNDGYRKVIIKNYVLIYRIDESSRDVYVVRFFYGSMNYAELL